MDIPYFIENYVNAILLFDILTHPLTVKIGILVCLSFYTYFLYLLLRKMNKNNDEGDMCNNNTDTVFTADDKSCNIQLDNHEEQHNSSEVSEKKENERLDKIEQTLFYIIKDLKLLTKRIKTIEELCEDESTN
jgi:hypothetical protein